jgi:hypothetical protein
MRKSWLIIIGSIAGLLIIIQFFQPEKNNNIEDPKKDIVFSLDIPKNVKKNLVNACYDCHSDRTVYPRYSRVAPISWMINKHIRDGKKHLNFSTWSDYDKRKQLKLLTEICDEITLGDMPLKGYVFMHSKAVLNEKDIADICAWTENAGEQVFNQSD